MVATNISQVQTLLREHLPLLSQRFSVESLGLFGSRVRGDHRPDSDLDVLVTFRETPGLFALVELQDYLTELLGVQVDLALRESLKPRIGKQILAEVGPV